MQRLAMGAMALAGLTALASADHAAVTECLAPISAQDKLFSAETGTSVDEARKFSIEYLPNYKVVTNLAAKRQYVLYPCGAEAPDVAALSLPAGFQRKLVKVPAQKAVTAETVSYDFMTQLDNGVNDLGVTDRLLALSPYTTNACGQKALACKPEENKLVAGLGPAVPGWGAKAEDYQKFMNAADVYFDSSDGKKDVTDDKSVIFSATQETSLLGRGEWLKFAAAFFNLDHVAEKKFDETREAYLAISAQARQSENRPKAVFIDIDSWGDATGVNDYFTISLAGYKRSAVLDAGGFIPNVEDFVGMTNVSFPTNMRGARWAVPKPAKAETTDEDKAANAAARTAAIANFLKALEDVDVVIDERYVTGPLTIEQALAAYGIAPTDTQYKFVANKKWFREDKSGSATGSAWFETGVSRPDLVLSDFVKVLHPEAEVAKAHETQFLRDVFAAEAKKVITPEDCKAEFPICAAAIEHYPSAPICPVTTFKSCADDSKVFLSAASDCTKFESCSLETYANKVKDSLPASTSITIAVFMAFVAIVLVSLGYIVGKKRGAAKKNGQGIVTPDGAALH